MACSCAAAANLTCLYHYKTATFHRLHHCFLPHLIAFDAAVRAGGCIFAERNVDAALFKAFLDAYRASYATTARVVSLSKAARPSHSSSAARWWRPSISSAASCGKSPARGGTTASGAPATLAWYMSLRALQSTPVPSAPYRILVQRNGGMRVFDRPTALLAALRATSPRWRTYHGNESLLDTLRLFGDADVVFGFHGAGLMNAVFSRQPCVRVHELTTYASLGAEARLNASGYDVQTDGRLVVHGGHGMPERYVWRSYVGRMAHRWNPRVRYSVHVLRLEPLLRANGVAQLTPKLGPYKALRRVPLSDGDIREIANQTRPMSSVARYRPMRWPAPTCA